ncbi:hypothetical protein [Paeniglutamicibacter kerguelensis]|uniref:Uncharacterized protein n=1 Tax=Paeniglutamicibacter kerguelensis TaxID=254788 RepID=A0ABS4XJ22_9MICC|nr:hypothetical protein [Paeniglutamicibacter kerguelensis]MBP2388452.1 hypothetical protein [Paeniglutamicibacter kerguelensis]
MLSTWYLVMFLVFLAVVGLIAGAVLLIKGLRSRPQIAGEALHRDREHLARLEAIDQRLERLEKTLHDLPS